MSKKDIHKTSRIWSLGMPCARNFSSLPILNGLLNTFIKGFIPCYIQLQHQLHYAFCFPTHRHHAPIPARYPEIQLNSDLIYQEIVSDPTGVGLSPARLFSLFQCQLQVQVLLTNRLYRSEVPTTPSLGLTNLLEWLTELRDTFHL